MEARIACKYASSRVRGSICRHKESGGELSSRRSMWGHGGGDTCSMLTAAAAPVVTATKVKEVVPQR